jgi:hypothetical protein
VRSLLARGEARLEQGWACHHTQPCSFGRGGIEFGIVGCVDAMCRRNLMAVEMEATAPYAFAQIRQRPVLCFAHVTNQMGRIDGDFENGEADVSHDALQLIAIAGDRLRSRLLP